MAAGRPTLYKDHYVDQVKKLCYLGATDEQIADFFGIAESTLNLWKNAHPEFMEAIKTAKLEADTYVAKSLYHRAIGYEHPEDKIFSGGYDNDGIPREPIVVPTVKHYAPDTTAAIFWLKNRQPKSWRDRHEVQQDTTVNVNIVEFNYEEENDS